DGECRALAGVAVAVGGNARSSEPSAPVSNRGCDSRLGGVDVLRCREPFRPGERAIRPLARLQKVARPNAAALDSQCEIRVQTDRLLSAARIGYMAVAVPPPPFRRHMAVVKDGLADQLDLRPAFEAQDRS